MEPGLVVREPGQLRGASRHKGLCTLLNRKVVNKNLLKFHIFGRPFGIVKLKTKPRFPSALCKTGCDKQVTTVDELNSKRTNYF